MANRLVLLIILTIGIGVCNADEDYVDFTDMGSYHHISQKNDETKGGQKIPDPVDESKTKYRHDEGKPCPDIDDSISMKFLKRIVASLLRQINVRSHVFGPRESITIDLRAEISHEDFTTLNMFVGSNNSGKKHLTQVDDILSNLLHVVEPPVHVGFLEYIKEFTNFQILYCLKFWLIIFSLLIVTILVVKLSLRTLWASSPRQLILYGCLSIFVVSCVWTFADLYEEKRAANYARLIQTESSLNDCNWPSFGLLDSVGYYLRVQLGGYKDRCEQYHQTVMIDPFWSVNPMEAISKSFTVFIFAPIEYVGLRLGRFFNGLIGGVPFWLQPIFMTLFFGFAFLGIFGYSIRMPFISIEPMARRQLEHPHQQQLIERPEASVVRVASRDCATDTDDLGEYIAQQVHHINLEESVSTSRCERFCRYCSESSVLQYCLAILHELLQWLDMVLRQCPVDNTEEDEGGGDYNVVVAAVEPDIFFEQHQPEPIVPRPGVNLRHEPPPSGFNLVEEQESAEIIIPNPPPLSREFNEKLTSDCNSRDKERADDCAPRSPNCSHNLPPSQQPMYGWVYVEEPVHLPSPSLRGAGDGFDVGVSSCSNQNSQSFQHEQHSGSKE